MHAREVLEHEIERDCMAVILCLLAEPVRQARESPHAHSDTQVLPLDIAGTDVARVQAIRTRSQLADYFCYLQQPITKTYSPLAQRAFAAFWAVVLRSSGESLSALALPCFFPPSWPRATAAGFFGFLQETSTVSCAHA